MVKLVWAVVGLVLVYVLFIKPERMPSEQLPTFSKGTLGTKAVVGGRCPEERCLTIVVAPWCPACRRMKGTITALQHEVLAAGKPVALVIGMDQPEALQNYANQHPETVLLDMERKFTQRAKIGAVPYFAVTNRKGEIIKELKGGYDDVGEMRRQLGV